MSECEFADGWKNQEGWFVIQGKLVCADWDEFCTRCRIDDSEDYIIVLNDKLEMVDDGVP